MKAALAAALVALAGCGAAERQHRAQVTRGVKQYLTGRIDAWLAAAEALQRAAPTGRGWDPTADAAALAAMKAAWVEARWSYELIEGAIAPLFPESDLATDARYEDYLLLLGPVGDPDPFDDAGVVGMHGIERILYVAETPEAVRAFERGLPGHRPAAQPATAEEAARFKDGLAAGLVREIRKLKDGFAPLELDLSFAFTGLVDLVKEQVEKVDKAASGQEESRYARLTLRDLRANHRGCLDVYALFRPWLLSKRGGAADDEQVRAGFDRLGAALAAVPGDAMPAPPPTWSSVSPRPEDLATPFGRLFSAVRRECDAAAAPSLLGALQSAGKRLGLELP